MSRYSPWPRYVPVAERRQKAAKKVATMKKQGKTTQPVFITGRNIANTFWGKAWCDNLEVYSDWANRLPRGRTYVRNGSVLDLQVESGKITALVMGSELYHINISILPLDPSQWKSIQHACAGKIDSLVELLQGKLSRGVMEIITKPGTGLFPHLREIDMQCSCPDYAGLCKHLAAVLYGIGARLDQQPELLFLLRQVDHRELIIQAAGPILETDIPDDAKRLDNSQLSNLFGIDLADEDNPSPPPPAAKPPSPAKPSKSVVVPRPPTIPIPTPAKPATTTRRARTRQVTPPPPTQMTARELKARGISPSTLQIWLASGVLLSSGTRGVYLTTGQTEARISRYLEKKAE
ncbi:SWIM-type domain-containing protein [Gammaproteobacteria bacterium]